MHVPFVDLKRDAALMQNQISRAVNRVIAQKNFILGEEVEKFEEEFAQFCGTTYCVGVGSGTDALRFSLEACGIGQGDEVITVANTFIATVLAISQVGAQPVFVDIDPSTYTIDANKIENKITNKTRAIIVVHLYGQPAAMKTVISLAKKYKLKVIEDACQAHGATYKGMTVGSIGDIGCFSFYPSKNLGAYGDAGAILTNNKILAEKIKLLRDYGQKNKYQHLVKGTNSRLDTIQAAVLRVKLKYLSQMNEQRKKNAKVYFNLLHDIDDIILPAIVENTNPVYHLFVVQLKKSDRDSFVEYLNKNEIGIGIHYPLPIYLQKAYSELRPSSNELQNTERVTKKIVSLPMFPSLRVSEIRFIVKSIKNFFEADHL